MVASSGWRGTVSQRAALGALTAGLALGGTAVSMSIWLLSGLGRALPPQPTMWGLVGVAVAALARDFGVVSFGLPENRRLIPQSVFHRGPLLGPFRFGFELGTGVRTYLPTTTPYLLALALVVMPPPWPVAILTGTAFGVGRSFTSWARYLAADKARWDERFNAQMSLMVRLCALAGSGGIALAAVRQHLGG
jgi:hypothetical protein